MAKHNPKTTNFSHFIKHKLPAARQTLQNLMHNVNMAPGRYSAQNCPTLFDLFHFSAEMCVLQITHNILLAMEDIQKLRDHIKTLKGLHRVRIPAQYKKIALNMVEINDQLKLFAERQLTEIANDNIHTAAKILLEALLAIHSLQTKSASKTFNLVIKALTPDLENEVATLPAKIDFLQHKITQYKLNKPMATEEKELENPLKNLYSKLNLNLHKWAIFRNLRPLRAPMPAIEEETAEEIAENNI